MEVLASQSLIFIGHPENCQNEWEERLKQIIFQNAHKQQERKASTQQEAGKFSNFQDEQEENLERLKNSENEEEERHTQQKAG